MASRILGANWAMTRKIQIKGYKLKAGKLVPDYRHLPVNIHLQKKASKRVRVAKSTVVGPLTER